MAKSQLTVDIDRSAVRLSKVIDGEVSESHCFSFKDKTDFGYKEQLDQFLTQTNYRQEDWDEFSLSWYSEKSTLLPYSIFGNVDTVATYKLSFGEGTPENDIDFNRIPEFTGVNIYEVPLWVKSFFIIRFPRMLIQHEGSHAIRGLFSQSTYYLNAILIVHDTHFILMAVKDNELQFYNSFEYQNSDDLIYHTAHVLETKNWKETKGKLTLVPYYKEENQLLADFETKTKKIASFKQLEITQHKNLINQYQTLCV
ncbi:MAG: hypothetical protein ACI9G9_001277 [Psychromonas sp.]|jgi:hypothetical protein